MGLLDICPRLLPVNRPFHIHDILQLVTHLDDPTAHHPRIYRYRLSDKLLCGRGGVESHYEVVAAGVAGLVLLHWFGEEAGAPVRDAADDTALGEDEGASCASESEGKGELAIVETRWWRRRVLLFDFIVMVGMARANLCLVSISVHHLVVATYNSYHLIQHDAVSQSSSLKLFKWILMGSLPLYSRLIGLLAD